MTKTKFFPPPSRPGIRDVLNDVKRNFDAHLALQELTAQLDRERFKAWVNAGFTEEQALELLKAEKLRIG